LCPLLVWPLTAGTEPAKRSHRRSLLKSPSSSTGVSHLVFTGPMCSVTGVVRGEGRTRGSSRRTGRTLWMAVRGQRHVSVLSVSTGREVDRIPTANGPSKGRVQPRRSVRIRKPLGGRSETSTGVRSFHSRRAVHAAGDAAPEW
jgi:hypothetical protein